MKPLLCCLAMTVVVGCGQNEEFSQQTIAPEVVAEAVAEQIEDAAMETVEQTAGESNETEFVIDVRGKSEWDTGHVAHAAHIPHTEIVERIGEVTDDKNARIVVYCAVGGRAGKAKAALEELGFTNVENAGGFDDIKSRYEGDE
ncbi:MAG: rhodanese-like domain-containing protein [Rubripirellula sp.]